MLPHPDRTCLCCSASIREKRSAAHVFLWPRQRSRQACKLSTTGTPGRHAQTRSLIAHRFLSLRATAKPTRSAFRSKFPTLSRPLLLGRWLSRSYLTPAPTRIKKRTQHAYWPGFVFSGGLKLSRAKRLFLSAPHALARPPEASPASARGRSLPNRATTPDITTGDGKHGPLCRAGRPLQKGKCLAYCFRGVQVISLFPAATWESITV